MDHPLLNKIGLKTGGTHFPAVFNHYQKDYVLNVLSEIYQVYQKGENTPEDYLALDLWDDIVKHFKLDNYEIDKLIKKQPLLDSKLDIY
jgi:hypothetical protein